MFLDRGQNIDRLLIIFLRKHLKDNSLKQFKSTFKMVAQPTENPMQPFLASVFTETSVNIGFKLGIIDTLCEYGHNILEMPQLANKEFEESEL